jgi:hypothetical protein
LGVGVDETLQVESMVSAESLLDAPSIHRSFSANRNSGGKVEQFWSFVFNLLLHGMMVGAMVLFLGTLILVALQTDDRMEKLRRGLALFVGAMIVVGAEASGLSFAAFTAGALGVGRGASAAATAVASIIPAVAGVAIGFYLVRTYRKHDVRGIRLICFVGMLALASFVQVYATITHAEGIFVGASAIPNLAFAAGVVMVFIFGDDTKKPGRSFRGDIGGAISRHGRHSGVGASSPAAQWAGNQPASRQFDPFDF